MSFKNLFIFYSLLSCVYSFGCSTLQLELLNRSVEVFEGQVAPFRFRVRSNNGTCVYFVGISRGAAVDYQRQLSNGFDRIPANLYKFSAPSAVIYDAPDIRQFDQTWFGFFTNSTGRVAQQTGYAALGNLPSVSAGRYSDIYQVNLYRGFFFGGYRLMDSRALEVFTRVNSSVAIGLVEVNAPFDPNDTYQSLDFGELTQGESQSFDIVVEANGGYALSMSAMYDGKMKHATETSTVDYLTQINGGQISLTGSSSVPVEVAVSGSASAPGGDRYRCRIVIGDPSQALGGRYNESITITATAY